MGRDPLVGKKAGDYIKATASHNRIKESFHLVVGRLCPADRRNVSSALCRSLEMVARTCKGNGLQTEKTGFYAACKEWA